jgi:ATP-dependent RNA helicase SUPV3L1/SUV3
MAKKKRRHYIKLNNKIKELFDGHPFDEGVMELSDEELTELLLLLDAQPPSLEREEMIRTLRRLWSDGEFSVRKTIVDHLTARRKGEKKKSSSPSSPDKVERILSLLDGVETTPEEEEALLEHFLEMRSSKITREKLLNKLEYLRLLRRIRRLEERLEVEFTERNEMEFVASFEFRLENFDFTKHLTVRTPPLELERLWEMEEERIVEELAKAKEEALRQKEEEIALFLSTLRNHRYLSEEEIHRFLRRMPMDGELRHAPIDQEVLERIVHAVDPALYLIESGDHILLEREKSLELYGTPLPYRLSLSYERNFLYAAVWESRELPIAEDLEALNQSTVELLLVAVEGLGERLREVA